MVFNYFSENHHEFWDLGVQIARSPRPEGVRRCPIACWKATYMHFTKIKKYKVFRFFFDRRTFLSLENFEILIFQNNLSLEIFDFQKNSRNFRKF